MAERVAHADARSLSSSITSLLTVTSNATLTNLCHWKNSAMKSIVDLHSLTGA